MKKIILFMVFLGLVVNTFAYDKKSLVERFTNASCAPCASLNSAWYNATTADMLNTESISQIIYNVWWPGANDPMYLLNTPDNTTRTNYYGVNSVPWIVINGVTTSATQTAFVNAVNTGNSQYAPFKIVMTQRAMSDNLVEIGVKIIRDPSDITTFGTTKLKVALTEKMVVFPAPPGTNGESHFSSVCRKMMPDGNGTTLTIPAPGDSTEVILQYVPTASFLQSVNMDSLRVVAFIQNESNKSIYQSEMLAIVPNFVAQINSPSPDVIADNSTPVIFNAVIKNIGMMTDVYTINCSLNSPTGWIGEYTTANGTFQFGVADSIEIDPDDSTVIQVEIDPQGINGYGNTTVEFESHNNPGMIGTITFNNVTSGGTDILIVSAGSRDFESYVTGSVANVFSGTYGAVSRSALEPVGIDLSSFSIVVWQASNSDRAFYENEVAKLEDYLDGGGNLFITGQNIGADIFGTSGQSQFAQDFYHNYLHTDFVADVSNLFLIKGVSGDIISDGVQYVTNSVYNRSLDKIAPKDTTATSFLTYFNGPDVAGVRSAADNYRVVYMVTGLEQITEQAIRDTIAARSLRWLAENVVVGVGNESNVPLKFVLEQNYPNPFNPVTSINYSISEKSFTTLKIYDIIGNEVASLVNEEKSAGNYIVNFDASKLSSGVYLYKLQSNGFTQTKKMMLLK
ncbi:MAG: T9SS type A sorting domain-containing protein [Ignavibacteriaceae bacterium]